MFGITDLWTYLAAVVFIILLLATVVAVLVLPRLMKLLAQYKQRHALGRSGPSA